MKATEPLRAKVVLHNKIF